GRIAGWQKNSRALLTFLNVLKLSLRRVADVQILGDLDGDLPINLSLASQAEQSSNHDGLGVDVEEPAGGGAGIGETEAIGTQVDEITRHPTADLLVQRGGEVADRDERALVALQHLLDVRSALLLARVAQLLQPGLLAVAGQLVPAGHGGDIGITPVLGEHLLGTDSLDDAHVGGEDDRGVLQLRCLARVPGDALVDADQIVRRAPQVDAFEQPLDVKVLWLGRLVHRLVVDGEVVDDVLALAVAVRAGAFAVHALHAVAQDVGDL